MNCYQDSISQDTTLAMLLQSPIPSHRKERRRVLSKSYATLLPHPQFIPKSQTCCSGRLASTRVFNPRTSLPQAILVLALDNLPACSFKTVPFKEKFCPSRGLLSALTPTDGEDGDGVRSAILDAIAVNPLSWVLELSTGFQTRPAPSSQLCPAFTLPFSFFLIFLSSHILLCVLAGSVGFKSTNVHIVEHDLVCESDVA
jgi:hypothetical protein